LFLRGPKNVIGKVLKSVEASYSYTF